MITKPTLRDRISTQLQYLCDATFKDEQKTCEAHADIILKDIEQEVWIKLEERKAKWYNDSRFHDKCFTAEDIFAELSQTQQDIKRLFD